MSSNTATGTQDNQSGRGTQGSGNYTMQPEGGQNVPLGVHGGISAGDATTPPTGSAAENEEKTGSLAAAPDTHPQASVNTPPESATSPGDPSDSGAPAG